MPTSFTGEPVWERPVGIDWRRSGPGLVEFTGWVPIDDVELRPMSPAAKRYRWAQVTLESPTVGGITEPPVPLLSVSEVDRTSRIVTREVTFTLSAVLASVQARHSAVRFPLIATGHSDDLDDDDEVVDAVDAHTLVAHLRDRTGLRGATTPGAFETLWTFAVQHHGGEWGALL